MCIMFYSRNPSRARGLTEHTWHFLRTAQVPHYIPIFHNFLLLNPLIDSFRGNSLPSFTEDLICFGTLKSQVKKKKKFNHRKITLSVGESPFFGTRSCISSPSCVNHLLLPAFHTKDSTQLISGWVFSESPILLAVETGNKSKIPISAS